MSATEQRLAILEAEVQALRDQVERLQNGLAKQWLLATSGKTTQYPMFESLECNTIKCSKIEIIDHDGRERVEMSADESSAVGIRVWDAEGSLRITMQSLDNGSAGITLWDQEGKIRVIIQTDLDGNPTLNVGRDADEDEGD